MEEQKIVSANNDSFELSVYKFMNYSSSSTFYLILTISSFFSAMTLNNLFSIRFVKDLPMSGVLQPTFLMIIGVLIGLLLWRLVVNRLDSRASIKKAIAELHKNPTEDDTKRLTDVFLFFKKLTIEKLRKVRLFSSIVVSMYILFLTSSVVETLVLSKPLDLLVGNYIFYYILIALGTVGSILTTIFINKKFNQYINTHKEITEEDKLTS
jgi:hypothetical protein